MLCGVIFATNTLYAGASSSGQSAQSVTFSSQGLLVKDSNAELKVGLDAEVGVFYDFALHACFGVEGQWGRFSKMVLPFRLRIGDKQSGMWEGVCELAPLYDSIRKEAQPEKFRPPHEGGFEGAIIYRDWYKNMGSRLYFLGNVPLVQTFLSYATLHQTFSIGRMKNLVGFDDQEMPWRDDGKMAPMGFWLSKDLLTGVAYRLNFPFFRCAAGVFSGHNPLKSSATYLHENGVQDPNTKANNTATYTGNIEAGGVFSDHVTALLSAGYQFAIAGSTWRDDLQDGKRDAHVGTICGQVKWHTPQLRWMQSGQLFTQATYFKSGLKPDSTQNKGGNRYYSIIQKGIFAGIQGHFAAGVSLWFAAEWMDRFDAHLFALGNCDHNNPLKKAVQRSLIFGARYTIKPGLQISWAYHKLHNPAEKASEIQDYYGSNRWKCTLEARF